MVDVAILDGNVVLRHLLNDHADHSPAARHLLGRLEGGEVAALLTAVAVAEVVWVLTGRQYSWPRGEVAEVLSGLLAFEHLVVPERADLQQALDIFAQFPVDFADAYNAAIARRLGGGVYSFDRDFDRLPGVERVEPTSAG